MSRNGAVAQLVERLHGMEKVRGSIPLSSTKKALLRGHERGQWAGLLPLPVAVGPGVTGLGREHPTSPRHDEQAAGGEEHNCGCDKPVCVRTGRRKYRWFATD